MSNLTDKQKRFCVEFTTDFNATQAYLRAGYQCSRKAAESSASNLLRNPKIQAYLSQLRDRISERSEITLERTVQEIGRIAFSQITNVIDFDKDGVILKNSSELPVPVIAAIASVKSVERIQSGDWGESRTIEYSARMHDKVRALTLLADFFGIRTDFNQARAALNRYGLALVQDESEELGWRLERYGDTSTITSAEAEQAAEAFFSEENDEPQD